MFVCRVQPYSSTQVPVALMSCIVLCMSYIGHMEESTHPWFGGKSARPAPVGGAGAGGALVWGYTGTVDTERLIWDEIFGSVVHELCRGRCMERGCVWCVVRWRWRDGCAAAAAGGSYAGLATDAFTPAPRPARLRISWPPHFLHESISLFPSLFLIPLHPLPHPSIAKMTNVVNGTGPVATLAPGQ